MTGERVFLRSPERGDYEAWASLRALSRNFLAPWEPSWPADALEPRRVSVPAWPAMPRTGELTKPTICSSSPTTTRWSAGSACPICGAAYPRLRASAIGSANLRAAGLHDRGVAAGSRFLLRPASPSSSRGCLPAEQHPEPIAADPSRFPSRRAMPGNISASKANGRTICFSRSCVRIGADLGADLARAEACGRAMRKN